MPSYAQKITCSPHRGFKGIEDNEITVVIRYGHMSNLVRFLASDYPLTTITITLGYSVYSVHFWA